MTEITVEQPSLVGVDDRVQRATRVKAFVTIPQHPNLRALIFKGPESEYRRMRRENGNVKVIRYQNSVTKQYYPIGYKLKQIMKEGHSGEVPSTVNLNKIPVIRERVVRPTPRPTSVSIVRSPLETGVLTWEDIKKDVTELDALLDQYINKCRKIQADIRAYTDLIEDSMSCQQ